MFLDRAQGSYSVLFKWSHVGRVKISCFSCYLRLYLVVFSFTHQASEREGRQLELQEMLELWEKEKAEAEGQHEKKLFDMKEKVATMQAQQEEERTRVESANQEVNMKAEFVFTLLHYLLTVLLTLYV